MTRLLLDASISPETGRFLVTTFGLDVADLISRGQSHLSDERVAALAQAEGRVIITLDLDFGEIYHQRERGRLGVIVLRLRDQTVESVNRTLSHFFNSSQAASIDLEHSLVVIQEHRIRVVRGTLPG